MAKANILIAEDDSLLRSIYVKKFSIAGFEIRTACDGEEAIKAIEQNPPDLLLCDINMPKADGLQVLEHFPKPARTFPVIMLTNFDGPDFREKCDARGADGYFIKKDMTIRSLLTLVEGLL